MSLLGQGTPVETRRVVSPTHRLGSGMDGRATAVPDRVHWLYSGVLLGAVGWLLVLAVIFVLLGQLIVAGGMLAGACLCVIPLWRAGKRASSAERDRAGSTLS